MTLFEEVEQQARSLGLAIAKERQEIIGRTEFLLFCIQKLAGDDRFEQLKKEFSCERT